MNWIPIHPLEERGGSADRMGLFLLGDSADAGRRLAADWTGKVQMLYLDPPFMSGGKYTFTQRVGVAGWKGKARARLIRTAYTDRWKSREEYMAMLRGVLEAALPLLRQDGSVFVHVDWRASPHVRLLLDQLLGEEHFRNEIIWAYNSGGRSKDSFSRKHDSIFYYRVGKKAAFYPDAVGIPRGREKRNHMKRGVEKGRVYFAITVGGKEYRYYEDEKMLPGDVWTDIPALQQRDPQRTGYETQKPLALLERLILASTKPGDAVLDLFSGSGTTAAATAGLGRIPLAADMGEDAQLLFRRRVLLAGGGYTMEPPKSAEHAPLTAEWSDYTPGQPVTFLRCEVGDIPRPPEDKPLLPDRLWAADAWSVGSFSNGVYTAAKFFARTPKQPALPNEAVWEVEEGALPALSVTDAGGRTGYWVQAADCPR